MTLAELIAETDAQIGRGQPAPNMLNVTNEQLADKLWSESCQEIRAEMPRLRAMFARHQRAIEEGARYGRQCALDMDEETKRYWQEWQVQRLVEAERAKGK
jgi:hypothetical protein